MILNAEALEVLSFLKSTPGQFVSMRAISIRAGGRRRFEESPGWAKGLMSPLVEAGLVEMNDRGHYRMKSNEPAPAPANPPARPAPKTRHRIVGDDYFPVPDSSGVVGDNYFPKRNLRS
jgi:hypothetical protein